jgi:hypothetical protein
MSDFYNKQTSVRTRALGQGVTENFQSLAELRQELETLRKVVMRMVWCQVQGEPLALNEDPLRTWLGLPQDATPEEALTRLQRSQAKVLGTSACPSCGAQIQDKEGVANEWCPWCGAKLDDQG